MSNVELQDKRPLSPHLSVYKLIPTMLASIVNRITGAALYFGTIMVAWWLFSAATSPAYYNWVSGFFSSFIGRLVLFGYTWALLHHMIGGIRHLMWDMGHGFNKHFTTKLAKASWVISIGATILIWIIGYSIR